MSQKSVVTTKLSTILLVAAFFLNCTNYNSVSENCPCVKNDFNSLVSPDTIFDFLNNNRIYVCGTYEEERIGNIYSEFAIGICGESVLIKQWDALSNCLVVKEKDSLYVKELIRLPIGKKFVVQWVSYKVNKYSFDSDSLVINDNFDELFEKYTLEQIRLVNSEYESNAVVAGEQLHLLAQKLLVSAISGSHDSEKYFLEIKNKFNSDNSELNEAYEELIAIFDYWKKSMRN